MPLLARDTAMTIRKERLMKIRQLVVRSLCLLGLWLGLGLQAHAQTDTVTYVYTDPQGTPLVKADASGNVIARYDYTPYGNAVASLGNPPNGPGYTGHVNDPETGLVYMQARYYQPIGRFSSPDPLGPAAGNIYSFNRYAYANNNPIVNIDPTGEAPGDEDDFERSAYPVQVTFFGSGGDGGGGNPTRPPSTQGSTQAATPSGAKQFLIGLSKPVINLLDDIAAVMGDTEASNAPPLKPSNPSQAVGVMIGGVIVNTAQAAATDGVESAAPAVELEEVRINGFTKHGINRAIGDGGKRSGTRPDAILDALRNPVKTRSGVDDLGRPYMIYTGGNARVVVNPGTNQIISTNPLSSSGAH